MKRLLSRLLRKDRGVKVLRTTSTDWLQAEIDEAIKLNEIDEYGELLTRKNLYEVCDGDDIPIHTCEHLIDALDCYNALLDVGQSASVYCFYPDGGCDLICEWDA